MPKLLKRIIAYFIDILVVTSIASLLSNTSIINKNLNDYNKCYEEYITISETYSNFNKDIKKYYKDEKLSDKEYQSLLNKYTSYQPIIERYYKDNTLKKEDYEKLLKEVDKDYKEEYTQSYYKVEKYSTVHYTIYTIVILLYFIGFNLITNGQTLGKKIMRLKITTINDKPLNFINYLIRTMILYFPIYYIVKIIGVHYLNATNYYTLSTIFYEIQYYLKWIIILMIVIRMDGRGLHDLASQTKVISLDKNGLEIEEENINLDDKEKISNKNSSLKKKRKSSTKKNIVVDTTIDSEDE